MEGDKKRTENEIELGTIGDGKKSTEKEGGAELDSDIEQPKPRNSKGGDKDVSKMKM